MNEVGRTSKYDSVSRRTTVERGLERSEGEVSTGRMCTEEKPRKYRKLLIQRAYVVNQVIQVRVNQAGQIKSKYIFISHMN